MDNHPTEELENIPETDIISNLPSHVIDNILIFLPIHEAVRTCTLSKKWRFSWMYLPKLVFDDTFYQKSVLPCAPQPAITTLFFLNVFRVLLLHQGPLLDFTFDVSLLEDYPEIDHLMLYLSKKGVQRIFFGFGRNFTEDQRFPLYLFSCVNLRRLTLSGCSFTVPALAFQGFVKLIFLELCEVWFNTNEFETFISKCPLLETLSIKWCKKIQNLNIDIPHLKFFYVKGVRRSFCFRKPCQHLSIVIFDGYIHEDEASKPTEFFECLPVVEHLRLSFNFVGNWPRKLSVPLDCLRILELHYICLRCTTTISAVLCLIVSAPNLEKLDIMAHSFRRSGKHLDRELLEVQDLLDNALKRIRVVKMKLSNKRGRISELRLIKFLLAESVELEKMFIQPAKGTVAKQGLKILKKIIRFRRSSKKLEIVYLDP
ncbi:F-box/FBD/LRR-repeat protein At1g13570-like [Mercurialis annua]|uniref:F-box/FBD/LRR-repeat protein At1g13570-like n=1 Tax=Mercurialis annua TaxID=3986 RepID=UPI00215E2704|nr:F-box/FBD/LRR-repeat protein At1g13570-like [Mercurialis annua]